MSEVFHANLFPLLNANPLPVSTYDVRVQPFPQKKPLFYQILGITAKRLTRTERNPVISDQGQIKVLSKSLPKSKLLQKVSIENVGDFTAELQFLEEKQSTLNDFDEYKHLVNRLVDVALLYLSEDYYKYHPDAPYIVKDDHFFDKGLIEDVGIVDSKEYYRNLGIYKNKPYMILNRGTRLRSFQNLLMELKCLCNKYQKIRKQEFDFYNPTKDFVGFTNSLFRGKAANVIRYPGPSVKNIEGITWEYRCRDKPPNSPMSPCEYLRTYYGIVGLDNNQPLVKYTVRIDNRDSVQYHVPEVLSVGHNFRDLKRRIPSWQRPQVWDLINPDCKGQLREIFNVAKEIDSTLRSEMPGIYPSKVEISTIPANVTSDITFHGKISISFKDKEIKLRPPYYEGFYRRYSGAVQFLNPVGRDIQSLVLLEKNKQNVKEFFEELQKEFEKRNGAKLMVEYGHLTFEDQNFGDYDLVITVTDSGEIYRNCKIKIQNEHGVLHQNIRPENVTSDSIPQLVMQITLMFRGDPWLLKEDNEWSTIFGLHFYRSPFSGSEMYLFDESSSSGKLLFQSRPHQGEDLNALLSTLASRISQYSRVLLLLSFDQEEILERIVETLEKFDELEYVILIVKTWDNLRIFKTWVPKRVTLPPGMKRRHPTYPVEAFESAPQGYVLDPGNGTYHFVTSYSVRREATFRGCPIPIRIEISRFKGTFDADHLLSQLMSLTFMFRGSGHSTRLPAPLVYLKKYAYYVGNFGMPQDEDFLQKMFYL